MADGNVWLILALALAAVLATLLVAYRVHVSRAKARERALEEIVNEKVKDLQDAMERAQEMGRKLEDLRRHDLLTGVANRAYLGETFATEWRRGRRDKAPLAAIFFAIDDFKAYDEAFGAQAGDDCLCRVAAVLKNSLRRAGDVVARLGGGEFVILLPSTGPEGAWAVAKRILGEVAGIGIPHDQPAPGSTVSLSAGLASVVPGAGSSGELLSTAESALLEARRRGRGQVVAAAELANAETTV